jgi:hypothetical protein
MSGRSPEGKKVSEVIHLAKDRRLRYLATKTMIQRHTPPCGDDLLVTQTAEDLPDVALTYCLYGAGDRIRTYDRLITNWPTTL